MCGRYSLYGPIDLKERYNLATKPTFVSQDNYNVAPRQRLPIVFERDGHRSSELMQWGFIPFWSKDPSKERRPINTMAEHAFDSPMWRSAIKEHRCLIPARGFYEWKQLSDNSKVPYYIHPKGIDLFSFAGVFSIWNDVEGLPFYTFSIMTTTPNQEMEAIHNRMPVILHPEQEALWLDPQYREREQLASLLVPYEDNGLDIYRVSKDVNSTRNNDKHLVEAAHD